MAERMYSHVIVVGIDGAGAFIKDAHTPNFDRIFGSGAVTYEALASNPTISAECWGSMLLGVGPEVHGLTNEIVSRQPYPADSAFPSLFRRLRELRPEAELGSFCQWSPITRGIVERDLGVANATGLDTLLTPKICGYIRARKPEFLFIQLDSVDGAGHRNGYGTEKHLARISEVDGYLGAIYGAAESAGILENTLFIAIADHGGTNPGTGSGSHGGWTDEEKYVTFAALGKNVRKGTVGQMNIRDLAAIVLYALGVEPPEFDEKGWTAQIPEDLFEDTDLPAYRDISHLTGAEPRISRVPHTSELV